MSCIYNTRIVFNYINVYSKCNDRQLSYTILLIKHSYQHLLPSKRTANTVDKHFPEPITQLGLLPFIYYFYSTL